MPMPGQTSQTEVLVPNAEQLLSKDSDAGYPKWKDSYTQITGAIIIHLLTIQVGINMAFSAILLPQLREKDSGIQIETWEGAWIASLVTISLPLGSLLSGPLMDRYGRRNFSLFICIPYLISWILIYWSYNVKWLYCGRIIAGAAGGLSTVAIHYTAETTHPLWRPMLLGLNSVCVSVGILLTAMFGIFFHWKTISIIFALLNASIFCLIATLPESPHWLLSFGYGTQDINRINEARKSLKWFNRDNLQVERELNQLLHTYRSNNVATSRKNRETLTQKLADFKKPEIYKPIIILVIMFFLQQNTGTYLIVFYAIDLFHELGGQFGFLNEYGAMILLGITRFVMAIITLLLSKRYGRRTLSIVSGLGMAISMLSASVYMKFTQFESKIPTLIFVLLFVCFTAIGWQSIPWTLTGELLPTRIRAIMGGIITSYTYGLMFLVVYTFPALKEVLEVKYIFLIFSITSFISTIFVWKYVPETLGKTLVEIEQYFK